MSRINGTENIVFPYVHCLIALGESCEDLILYEDVNEFPL